MSRQLYEIKDMTQLNQYKNISFVGIQGRPGLQFKINSSGIITVGNSGMLQIDLTNNNIPSIESICFVKEEQEQGNLPLIVHLIAEKVGDN